MGEENEIRIPAVIRTLDIFENLLASTSPKSLSELSKELNIPQASLFRILKSMESKDYITTIEEIPYKYEISYKVIQLVTEYKERYSYNKIVKPVMEILTNKTHQTAQYAIFKHSQFLYIEQVLSTAELNYIAQLYKPLEINTSAGAKIILANQPSDVQNHYLSNVKLGKKTDKTATDIDELRKDLEISYKRGYALDDEEFAVGIGCMAVPIFDKRDKCVGAIGVTGRIQEYQDKENFNYILTCLKEAAHSIMNKLVI
jgi:DNA-binding IclR family transcriptional regulator